MTRGSSQNTRRARRHATNTTPITEKDLEVVVLNASDDIYKYESRTSIGSRAVKLLINKRDRHVPTLDQGGHHEDVERTYTAQNENKYARREATTTIVLSYAQGRSIEAHRAIRQTLEILIEGMGRVPDKHGHTPAMMDTPNHYLAEHSLHATSILLASAPNAPLGAIIAALYHDFLEDVILKAKPATTTREAALKEAEQVLFNLFGNYTSTTRQEVAFALRAVKRLTLQKEKHYLENLALMVSDEREDANKGAMRTLMATIMDKVGSAFRATKRLATGEANSPETMTELINRDPRHEEREISYALMAKLADKIAAVQTLSPYGYHKKLSIYAKTWMVLNLTREYLAQHPDNPFYQELETLTVQAAIATRKSLRHELHILTNDFPPLYKLPPGDRRLRGKRGAEIKQLNEYIGNGGLNHLEIDEKILERHRDFARTTYSIIILGSHLDDESVSLAPGFIREGETETDARKRLLQEQEAFGRELPDETIATCLVQQEQSDPAIMTNFPTRKALQEGAHRLYRRLLSLERSMTKYCANKQHRVEGF